MQITIIAIGSRGDVQPFVALGLGLQQVGYAVRLATHTAFEALVKSRGLDFYPVAGDVRGLIEGGELRAALEAGSNPLPFVRHMIRVAKPIVQQVTIDMLQASRDADMLILAGMGFYGGYDVAEALGLPVCVAALQPMAPTRAFQNPFFPPAPGWFPLQEPYHWLSHWLFGYLFWGFMRGLVNKARRAVLNLPPTSIEPPYRRLNAARLPVLYGYSPAVLPPPPDWGKWINVAGYWFLDQAAGWQPPADLVAFLNSGPPPVYIGFGSMNSRNPQKVTNQVVQALTLSGQRGVLLMGWGGLHKIDLPAEIFTIDSIPHDWLFPRMAAIVHHGGAGTTAAGLRAGVPSIILPFMGDQPFWGWRVHQLGVGPPPIPQKRLTAERLAAAIQVTVNDRHMQARAASLGEQIQNEDGVGRAVEFFQRHFPN